MRLKTLRYPAHGAASQTPSIPCWRTKGMQCAAWTALAIALLISAATLVVWCLSDGAFRRGARASAVLTVLDARRMLRDPVTTALTTVDDLEPAKTARAIFAKHGVYPVSY